MPTFDSDGVRIAYSDDGAGDPILLIHGFASSIRDNWIDPTWVGFLAGHGFRVVAIDNRGHGDSAKLYDRGARPRERRRGGGPEPAGACPGGPACPIRGRGSPPPGPS
jgi:pimeloyl-ACP methyl ester carboxylesterase